MAQRVDIIYNLVDKISKQAEKISKTLDSLEDTTKDYDKTLEKLNRTQGTEAVKASEKLRKELDQQIDEVKKLDKAHNFLIKRIDTENKLLKGNTDRVKANRAELRRLAEAVTDTQTRTGGLLNNLSRMSTELANLTPNLRLGRSEVRGFSREVDGLSSSFNGAGGAFDGFVNRLRRFVGGRGEIRKAFRDVFDFSFFRAGAVSGLQLFESMTKILGITPLVGVALGGLTQIVGALGTGILQVAGSLGRLTGALAVLPGLYGAIASGFVGFQAISQNFFKPVSEGGKQLGELGKQIGQAQKDLAAAKTEAARVAADATGLRSAGQATFGMRQELTSADKDVESAQENLNKLLEQQSEILDKMPQKWERIYELMEQIKDQWRSLWVEGQNGLKISDAIIKALEAVSSALGSSAINRVISSYASLFGLIANLFDKYLTDPTFLNAVAGVWIGAIDNLKRLIRVFDQLMPYLVEIASAINDITEYALTGLSSVLADLIPQTGQFADRLERAASVGDFLREWGKAGVDSFVVWSKSILNIVNAFRILADRGGIIDTFEQGMLNITQRFEDWAKTVDQAKLDQFFSGSIDILKALGRVLLGIGDAIGKVLGDPEAVKATVDFLDILASGFSRLGGFMRDSLIVLGPKLNKMLKAIGDALEGEGAGIINAIGNIVDMFTKFIELVDKVTPEGMLGWIVQIRLGMMALGFIAGQLLSPFARLGKVLFGMAKGALAVGTALEFIKLYYHKSQAILGAPILQRNAGEPFSETAKRAGTLTPRDVAERTNVFGSANRRARREATAKSLGEQVSAARRSVSGYQQGDEARLKKILELRAKQEEIHLKMQSAGYRELSKLAADELLLHEQISAIEDERTESKAKQIQKAKELKSLESKHAKAIAKADATRATRFRELAKPRNVVRGLARVGTETTGIPTVVRGGRNAVGNFREAKARNLAFSDEMIQGRGAQEGGFRNTARTLMPRTSAAAEAVGKTRTAGALGKGAKGVAEVVKNPKKLFDIAKAIASMGKNVLKAFGPVGWIIEAIIGSIVVLVNNVAGVRDSFMETVDVVIGPLKESFKGLFDALGFGKGGEGGFFSDLWKVLDMITKVIGVGVVQAVTAAMGVFVPWITFIIDNVTSIINLFNDLWKAIKKIFSGDIIGGFKDLGGALWNFGKGIFDNIIKLVKTTLEAVWTALRKVMINFVLKPLETALNWVIKGLNKALDKIPGVGSNAIGTLSFASDMQAQMKAEEAAAKAAERRQKRVEDLAKEYGSQEALTAKIAENEARITSIMNSPGGRNRSGEAVKNLREQNRLLEDARGLAPKTVTQATATGAATSAADMTGVVGTDKKRGAQIKWDMGTVKKFVGEAGNIRKKLADLIKTTRNTINFIRDYPMRNLRTIMSGWQLLGNEIYKALHTPLQKMLNEVNAMLAAFGQTTITVTGFKASSATTRQAQAASGGGGGGGGAAPSGDSVGGSGIPGISGAAGTRDLFGGHPSNVASGLIPYIQQGVAAGLQVTSTTDHSKFTKSDNISNHFLGTAVDLAGSVEAMDRVYRMFVPYAASGALSELIYKNFGWSRGKSYRYTGSDHFDHVHLAYGGGGGPMGGAVMGDITDPGNMRSGGALGSIANAMAQTAFTAAQGAVSGLMGGTGMLGEYQSGFNPNTAQNRAMGQTMAAARGWTGEQWAALDELWGVHESGWNHLADNPTSDAYGIPQALPGSKMASHGADWMTNPATQIAWGLDYIAGRYGNPVGADNFWHNIAPTITGTNWYGNGGHFVAKKPTLIGVGDKQPEEVRVTPKSGPNKGKYGGGNTTVINSTVNLGNLVASEGGLEEFTEKIGTQLRKDIRAARKSTKHDMD